MKFSHIAVFPMETSTMRRSNHILTIFAVALAITQQQRIGTAQVVYDNTNVAVFEGFRDWGLGVVGNLSRFVAQPFRLDEGDTLSQVTVGLSRWGNGSGTLRLSVWNDSGEGIPGTLVDDVGSLDVASMEDSRSFALPMLTFDTQVTGLVPEETYYLLLDYRDVAGGNPAENRTVVFGAIPSSNGTGSSSPLMSTFDADLVTTDWQEHDWFTLGELGLNSERWLQMRLLSSPAPFLQAGDADQDLDFDQLDLVRVQVAAKYLSGEAATWGEGDWDGAPGGRPDNPPAGDGLFNQVDIIAAQQGAAYLTGPYAALETGATVGDSQTSIVYNAGTGELAVDAPAGTELTSINIDSASSIFTGSAAANLGGSFDNDADANIFKATFGGSFGSVSFGNVAQIGLSEAFVLNDLSVVGSLAGGGDLGNVDLVYVPEPTSILLLSVGLAIGLVQIRRVIR